MAIQLDIAANTRDFQRGVQDVEKALDKVADSLDDVTREGDRASDKIEDSFRDIARASKDTGRDIGRNMDDGFDRAKAGAGEFKDEANSTAREAAASFDGSADSIVDAFQEVTANAFGGFGPAGAVAGLAAAAGIGLVTQAFQDAEDKRQELEERADDLASAYIEAGSNVLDAISVASRTADVMGNTEEKKKVQEYADAIGIDLATAVRAYVGDANAMAAVNALAGDAQAELNDLHEKSNAQQTNLTQTEKNRIAELNNLLAKTGELQGVTAGANETFQTQQQVLYDLINEAEGATKEVDELGNALYTLPDGTQIMVDAETGQATTDVSDFKDDVDGIPEEVTTTVHARTSGVSAVERELAQLARNRNVVMNIQGQITRIGNQVW